MRDSFVALGSALKANKAKVGEPGVYFSVLPYMSFYTPGMVLAFACLLSCIFFAASVFLFV